MGVTDDILSDSRVELRHLRYFVAVASTGSFTAAARQLFVAQPSVSQQIMALESSLGVTLFDRTKRSVVLTQPGQQLLPLAIETLRSSQELQAVASQMGRAIEGNLLIGFLAREFEHPTFAAAFAELQEHLPDVTFRAHQVDFVSQLSALKHGTVDFAFLRGPVPDGIEGYYLWDEERIVVLPRGHPRAFDDELSLADLSDTPMVLQASHAGPEWLRRWIAADQDPAPELVAAQAASIEELLATVGSGAGYAIVSAYTAEFYPQPSVVFRPVHGLESIEVAFAVVRRNLQQEAISAAAQVVRSSLAAFREDRATDL